MRSGRAPAHRNQALESNGPEGRVRGTAQQILDRYLAMARDAQSSGDSVLAENLFQHAEHYQRLVAQFAPPPAQQQAPAEAPRSGDAAQDAEARPDREAADRSSETEGSEAGGVRPRRRRRQRNAPVEEAAAESGAAAESISAEEAAAGAA